MKASYGFAWIPFIGALGSLFGGISSAKGSQQQTYTPPQYIMQQPQVDYKTMIYLGLLIVGILSVLALAGGGANILLLKSKGD